MLLNGLKKSLDKRSLTRVTVKNALLGRLKVSLVIQVVLRTGLTVHT